MQYRRLIAWEKRLEREGPLLRRLLAAAPERSVLDLGCGTGEHVAFFADEGARAVGIDRSASMLAAAREYETDGRGRFAEGDLLELGAALGGELAFGLAICLGNVLPHVRDDAQLELLLGGVHDALLPGGTLLVQLVNYEGILASGRRHLPINVRPGENDGTEVVFLRLLRDAGDGRMLFFPTTLELVADDEDEPVRLVRSRRVELRAWTRDTLGPGLRSAGFEAQWHGDMGGGPFEPLTSPDLVVVARR